MRSPIPISAPRRGRNRIRKGLSDRGLIETLLTKQEASGSCHDAGIIVPGRFFHSCIMTCRSSARWRFATTIAAAARLLMTGLPPDGCQIT